MYNGQQPIFILKEGTTRTSGKTAQSNNIAAAKAVSDAVRSTLGPKGMDKMLVDSMGDVVITNDGATILKELKIYSIRLMTNNPQKIELLGENGINIVERVALKIKENKFNAHYLGTKAKKSGHLL